MSDEASTQPALESILKEMRIGCAAIGEELSVIGKRSDIVESRLA